MFFYNGSTALVPQQNKILTAQGRPQELCRNAIFIFLFALAHRRVLPDTRYGCRIANPKVEPRPEDKLGQHIEKQCL